MQQPAVLHPNQVRLACEGCRRQKVRCSRQTITDAPCVRCARLGLPCRSGAQRRVGRPPRAASPAGEAGAGALLGDDLLGDDDLLAWTMPAPQMPDLNDAGTPMDDASPPLTMGDAVLVRSDVAHFHSLSRINIDLHGVWDGMTSSGQGFTLDDLIAPRPEDLVHGVERFHIILKSAQELLSILKSLHRTIGTRCTQPDSPASASAPHHPPTLSINLVTSYMPSSPSTPSPRAANTPLLERCLDSPTAFLVISCYILLVKTLEQVFTAVFDRLSNPFGGPLPTLTDMRFGKLALDDFSTYGILHAEMFLHFVRQINMVLGFPHRLSSNSIWTGLLSTHRYRNMINDELGCVEGAWTTRPEKLVDLIITTRELMHDVSLMGYF
ncbi:hypothetical protein S40285_01723 [Stachybotrys chlorohalonatus IBT 40285]|uniref:Zn(2)-C6 fungal-type domain-containing protein n=1 Tax=Stachybotrys chlorohalonatus (strain IBT 40285) TaxID=1283841 RepID=A0A084R273_STAC4|nr:hypothetical protein S40285_01723 [Stachybotrys chlorohalonata IBT 40285]